MEEELIVESLSPIEKELIKNLSEKFISLEEASKKSSQDKTTSRRAIQFLENKKLVEKKTEKKKIIDLGILGINYLKKNLPERVLLNKLIEKKSIPISEVGHICNLNQNEAKIALGVLKKKAVIKIEGGRVILEKNGVGFSNKMLEEQLLEKLPMEFRLLESQYKLAFENLSSRKDIIEVREEELIYVKLNSLGKKIFTMDLSGELLEELTPKILKQNSWKGKKFRRYNLKSSVPRLYGGKRHFVAQAKDYAKSIWIEMGFKEMTGNLTDTSFWVFDSLFTAQDHPVREMQDTFFVKDVVGKLPKKNKDKKKCIVHKIKTAHEGGIDGSTGWQYEWDEEISKKVVLRTHTTPLSIKTLHEIKNNNEFPAKYFALGKCFRNETVDWSHGFEFNQTEGIVIDENANFRQLIGYLKEFFKKMGYEKIRIRPGYFAYTEPSLEIDIFHPVHKKWVELGGAGIFRPEVTIPIFGRHIPVLAWGPGFDRIIMEYFNITDLRDMYKNDINKLREIKFWRK